MLDPNAFAFRLATLIHLVSRANCWAQLMPRTGTRLVMAIFRCDPYDPA